MRMEVVRVVLQLSHYYPSDYVGRDKLGQSSNVGLVKVGVIISQTIASIMAYAANSCDFDGTGVSFKAIYTYIACYFYFMSIITNPMFGLKL